jgi:UDPglucose 6-dehydrogenase
MKIAVVGLGYVGLSNALLLAQKHQVLGVDISEPRIESLNQRVSPLRDSELEELLSITDAHWSSDISKIEPDTDIILIATPTDYDPVTDNFDTSSIESILDRLTKQLGEGGNSTASLSPQILVKSTIPVGYTQSLQARYPKFQIVFMPEFLREGSAMKDNLEPSRIVVGDRGEIGQSIAELYRSLARNTPEVLLTGPNEAEAIKLFSNTYLAMRVGFFNELDTYCMAKNLSAGEIVRGVGLDPRIGNNYNNPSFGYGGYCLPKDTKQLRSNFSDVPHALISGIVETNCIRMDFLASEILSEASRRNAKTIGIFRLVMKEGSDNFRSSSVLEIIERLRKSEFQLVIYEPSIADDTFEGIPLEPDFTTFAHGSDLIIANRNNLILNEYQDRVFTRDIFNRD